MLLYWATTSRRTVSAAVSRVARRHDSKKNHESMIIVRGVSRIVVCCLLAAAAPYPLRAYKSSREETNLLARERERSQRERKKHGKETTRRSIPEGPVGLVVAPASPAAVESDAAGSDSNLSGRRSEHLSFHGPVGGHPGESGDGQGFQSDDGERRRTQSAPTLVVSSRQPSKGPNESTSRPQCR